VTLRAQASASQREADAVILLSPDEVRGFRVTVEWAMTALFAEERGEFSLDILFIGI